LLALDESKKKIREIAEKCDVLTISHYHYDHYDPDEDFYEGKVVFAKSIEKNINKSQKQRGREFKKRFNDRCDLIYCDGKEFDSEFFNSRGFDENLKIKFSQPVPHGPEGVRLGFVLMCVIETGNFKLLHASDVQGPVVENARDHIIRENPDLLLVDGPPSYFLGWKFSYANLDAAKSNLLEIIKETNCEVILDHHLLRDLKYRGRFREVYETKKVKSFAEYLGGEDNLLEANRKRLWGK